MDIWVEKQVDRKIRRYIEAQRHIKVYENAPLGLCFTDPGLPSWLRGPVEQRIRELRVELSADIRLEWPS
ncbi:hypothetical protein [Micromonospora sp. KLBMP9576]|uniref:hypothetical protein n=1 Tax=Micromonospora sp. KLBMP9576 TaxID=3424769 RepID=UPI003D8C1443